MIPLDDTPVRFVIITSTPLTADEKSSISLHGKVVEYSAQLFQGISDIDMVSFDYLLLDINDSDDKNFIQTQISTVKDYIIVITSDNVESDPWLKTLVDGNYITNIIKKLPPANLSKRVFDQKLINTIYIPHRKSFCEKMTAKITPSCISGIATQAGATIASVIAFIKSF